MNEQNRKAILNYIDRIEQYAKTDPWLMEELRRRFGGDSDTRIDEIYEYCIERVIREQAVEFYKNFPLKSIVADLVEDYVRMESFHRKNNFGDFCLSLYQQIECITNKLCENATLTEITEKMWGCPAYVIEKDSISNRSSSDYNIASLIFIGTNKKTGLPNSVEKSRVTLQSQYAIDKVRIIVYFLGFKAMMKNSDYDSFVSITNLLSDIYQCRNMNHRGSTQNQWEKDTLNRITPLQSFYYFKFLGVLAQYVEYIKNGIPFVPTIANYCKTIEPQKVQLGPKIVGKVDLDAIAPKNKRR